ncbi:MAG: NAD(P)H-hydrate epimerase, partial [Phycisphaerales bacterium]|nr:NAD(P)H-hydrate epimerase [Phycisphaerales bacterium]
DPLVFGREAVRAVDREAIETFGMPGIVLMENAARGLADHVRDVLDAIDGRRGTVVIACGRGNNGGDGYAAARHLVNAGVAVRVIATGVPRDGSDAATNARICRHMAIPYLAADDSAAFEGAALIIDALYGTGLDRPLEGPDAILVKRMNGRGVPLVAADLPSGMDADTGAALGPTVRATSTVTFVGWKRGFLAPGASALTGDIVTVDIGAPIEVVRRHGVPRAGGSV